MIINFLQKRIKSVSQLIQTIAVDLVLVMLVDLQEMLSKCREIDDQNRRILMVAGFLIFLIILIDWKSCKYSHRVNIDLFQDFDCFAAFQIDF
jgi:hypothetical protein